MNPLISKARKPKFELVLRVRILVANPRSFPADITARIIDLNNVPLVTGISFVKWHLPSSTSAEHRGRTEREPIVEHKVAWEYTKTIPIRMTIDKSNNLQECFINFEVVQDYSSTTRGEKITLGYVSINLAEYVEESEMAGVAEEGVVRRYLMQNSKINSTLKVGISMKQVDGERNFVAPPLKTAPVFGGIAGIMAGEQNDSDDIGIAMPSISRTRDQGELQDMYRRALAASWAATPGELPADHCIEDIFNGGNGWKDSRPGGDVPSLEASTQFDGDFIEGLHHRRTHSGGSGKSTQSQSTVTTRKIIPRKGHNHSNSIDNIGISPGMQTDSLSDESLDRTRNGFRRAHEVDEFNIRDDLIAWRLPNKVF